MLLGFVHLGVFSPVVLGTFATDLLTGTELDSKLGNWEPARKIPLVGRWEFFLGGPRCSALVMCRNTSRLLSLERLQARMHPEADDVITF